MIITALLVGVFLLGALWCYQNYSRFFKQLNEIPGPRGIPILGNFFDLNISQEEIFQYHRKLNSKYFPIYKQSVLHAAAVNLSKPEDLEVNDIVLSSVSHIKKSRIYDLLHMWLGTGLLTSHGDKWKMRRKLLTPAFHFNILQNFINVFNEETQKLVENLNACLQEPYINVTVPITEFTLESVMKTTMGTSVSLQGEIGKNYKKNITNFSECILYRLIRPWWYNDNFFRFSLKSFTAYKIVSNLHKFTEKVINERKKTFNPVTNSFASNKKMAMLDLLLMVQAEHGSIDDDGIREEVDTFMFEGHDTTSVAICFILLLLANHQQIQEDVRQEIIEILGDNDHPPTYNDLQQLSYTERCIKESLRLYPSVPLIARDATEDIHTSTGYTIPKGAMIHIHIFDIHRNPTIYPNPLKFDPDRFLPENIRKRHPYAYIPFSAGPRNCIGQRFASLELKTVLCGILREFILEPVDKPEDIVFMADMVLRSKNEIKIRFLKRK